MYNFKESDNFQLKGGKNWANVIVGKSLKEMLSFNVV